MKSEVAHKWAKWLRHPCRLGDPHRCRAGGEIRSGPQMGKVARHPCRLGDPHRFRAGGEIRSGPQMGKVAMSPLPSRGSPPLHSWGGNQKWPTCGQSGYVTPAASGIPTAAQRGGTSEVAHKWAKWLHHPAVSGIPTASQRGEKSEVAHKWAKWLRHPCRLGDPHRFRAGGEIRSGPLVGKVAMSPLPSRGSPPLQSGGGNQKWPTSGQSGYVTPAVSGIPSAAERGGKSEVAHKWAKWLRHPCRLGDPHRCRAGGKSEVAHLWAKWLRHPCRLRDPHRCTAGGEIRSGPLVGKGATSPLPSRGSPPLHSVGGKSEVAHLWAKWLRHPCRLGDPHRCRAGGEIRSGPLVGKVATSPLPPRGSPPLQSGGGNQKWPTSGQSGYVTPAVSGIPTASERGGGIRSGPQMGKVATSPLPPRGSPPLQSGGGNQKWPTCGQSGYVTPAVSGIPTASERGGKSEVAHKWAKWLRHPCRLGDPHRCRAGGEIRSGPLVGKVATSPLPSRGSPPLQSGGGNQKWPTYGQSGYVTPAVSGIPTAAEQGGEIRSGPLVGKLATSPLPPWGSPPLHSGGGHQRWPTSGQSGYVTPAVSGIPTASERGGEIRSGPQMGKVATSPLPCRGSPPLQSGGGNQKWPTCGQSGYVTPAVSGIPTASERGGEIRSGPQMGKVATSPVPSRGSPPLQSGGGKSEVAHLWAKWLRHPCRLGDPHRFRAGGEIRSGQLMGKVATSPLPSRGSAPLQSGGGKSEVAHLWAKWLRHPCRLRDPHRCTAGGEIRSGPLVGKVATSPLPSRGSPPLQSGGKNQKWPTSGQSGYVTPAVSGIPSAAERGGKSEVAHKWAKWLRHPCRLGDPHRCRAGGKSEVAHLWAKWLRHPCRLRDPHRCTAGGEIRSGPLVGKGATSPLPSRGSPPLQSGRGKSEVAHLWAKWLRHPCRLGDPHRFRAGGEIRSGPQMGKVATSPLPSRGSPPLQSGGGNQKWPTCGQSGYVTPAASGIPTAAERGGKSAVAPLWAKWLRHPCRLGDPHRFRAGGGNQKWPTNGQSGYVTPAVSGIPTAAERGGKSEVAHLWAKWLRHPCRLGDPHRFRAWGEIRSGPQMGKVATSPLPPRGSPPLQSGGGNLKWPTCGQSGYVTPAVSGIPTASERGGEITSGPQMGKVATSPVPSRGSPPLQSGGGKSEVAHLWAKWLRHPCRLGDPHRCTAGGDIRSGPQVGKVATSPLPSRGSPPLQSGGGKSEVAHKWAKWLRHPCRLGDPHRCRAGGEIRSGPLVGKVATSPLPSRGSPPLQSGGGKSEVAHKWAKWLRHPCRLGDSHRCRAGGEIRSGPLVGKVATSPLPSRGSPPLQSGG